MISIKNQKQMIIGLFFTWGTINFVRTGLAYFYPYFSETLSMSENYLGYLTALIAMSWASANIAAGKLLEFCRPVSVLILGGSFLFAGYIMMSFVSSVFFLYAAFIIIGFGGGLIAPTCMLLIATNTNSEKRGTYMGIVQSALGLLSMGLGAAATPKLLQHIGWRNGYVLLATITVLIALGMGILLRCILTTRREKQNKEKSETNIAGSFRNILQYRNIRINIILVLTLMAWTTLMTTYGITFLIEKQHFSVITAGTIFSAMGIGGCVSTILASSISDKFGRKPVLIACILLGFIGLCGINFFGNNSISCMMFFFLIGLCCPGIYPLITGILPSESVPPQLIATSTSCIPAIGDMVGSVLAPVLVGIGLSMTSIQTIFIILIMLPVIALVAAARLIETVPISKN